MCLYLHQSISGVLPFPVISGGLNSLLRLIVKTITSANALGSYVWLYACIFAFALVGLYFLHFLYVCLYLIILMRVFCIKWHAQISEVGCEDVFLMSACYLCICICLVVFVFVWKAQFSNINLYWRLMTGLRPYHKSFSSSTYNPFKKGLYVSMKRCLSVIMIVRMGKRTIRARFQQLVLL